MRIIKKNFQYVFVLLFVISISLNLLSFIDKDNKTNPSSQNFENEPCAKPFTPLPIETVRKMIRNYKNNQLTEIKKGMESRYNTTALRLGEQRFIFEDARRVYFDMDTIRQFICTVDKVISSSSPIYKTDGRTPITKADLGFRIFYAAYNSPSSVKKQYQLDTYAGKHTVIIAATYRDYDGQIRLLDPYRINTSTRIPERITPNTTGKFMAIALVSSDGEPLARNHGSLCPPDNCDYELY